MKKCDVIEKSINSENSKIGDDILKIDGMSSSKVRHFLNNLINYSENVKYLEIGVWKGSTFVSAMYKNQVELGVAIDNFSEFGGPKDEFLENWNKFLSINQNLEFIESDFKTVDFKKYGKFNIYFYDGCHDVEEQYNAFKYLNNYLEDDFICIIDDWNDWKVKTGTEQIFKELEYQVISEYELPANFSGDEDNWWNGLYVANIKK